MNANDATGEALESAIKSDELLRNVIGILLVLGLTFCVLYMQKEIICGWF